MYGLFLILFSFHALALTGTYDIQVAEGSPGLFESSDLLGSGPAPKITNEDIKAALKEFVDPKKAETQLENLKGPGGKTKLRFEYTATDSKISERRGNLEFACGVADPEYKLAQVYGYIAPGFTSGEGSPRGGSEYASYGKYAQFKRASRAQIRRFIALCFSRLPGMPKLKAPKIDEKSQIIYDKTLDRDIYNWLALVPQVQNLGAKSPKVHEAITCLLSSASAGDPNRTGNVVVLQRSKDSDHDSTTSQSETNHLPQNSSIQRVYKNKQHYGIAFLDSISWNHSKSSWKKNAITTQGIWPNYQGGSIASLMSQLFKDKLAVNVNACLLSAGIAIPDPNIVFKKLQEPISCGDIRLETATKEETLKIKCQERDWKACVELGDYYRKTEEWDPEMLWANDKSKLAYKMACDANVAEGCYALGGLMDTKMLGVDQSQNEFMIANKKGCKLGPVKPECEFWNKNLIAVTEKNIEYISGLCGHRTERPDWKNKDSDRDPGRPGSKTACYLVAMYNRLQGLDEFADYYLEFSCNAFGMQVNGISPCTDLAAIRFKQGRGEEARQLLKEECNIFYKKGCQLLWDNSNEEERKKIIKDACFKDQEKCF